MQQFVYSKEVINQNTTLSFRNLLEPVIVIFNKASDIVLRGKDFIIAYSIPGGVYGYYKDYEVSDEELIKIKNEIQKIIDEKSFFEKLILNKSILEDYFLPTRRKDILSLLSSKEENLMPKDFRLVRVNQWGEVFLNDVNENYDLISDIELVRFRKGFLIIVDKAFFNKILPKQIEHSKFIKRIDEMEDAMHKLGVSSFADLNNIISSGELPEFIKISEAYQEKKIATIADCVVNHPKKPRVVFIAGPTSSGKTSFAKRLSIHLKVLGKKVLMLSLDDYYLPHSKIPIDPATGLQNFEEISALDLDMLKQVITDLFSGKQVYLPKYNFNTGGHVVSETPTVITSDTYVVLEGIHGLNPELWQNIGAIESYRIYISSLITLNIHDHLPMSTSDHRLIRRLVRDHLFRGYDFNETIKRWTDVIKSEYKNIFPYQETAHTVFNSALIYELAVFAHYAPNILIPEKSETEIIRYQVERLNRILSLFIKINPSDIPPTSILREFIGGSSFKY